MNAGVSRMSMRCWLVERDYDDKGLVRLIYATPDGTRRVIQERSARMLSDGVLVAQDIDPDNLTPVTDPATRARYVNEVTRLQDRHAPDERV